MDENGIVTILHEFTGGADGFFPLVGVLRASNGALYGTTGFGGSSACIAGCGTVFRIDSNGTFATVHTFETNGRLRALGQLIEPQPGDLWGVTEPGGDCCRAAIKGAERYIACISTAISRPCTQFSFRERRERRVRT